MVVLAAIGNGLFNLDRDVVDTVLVVSNSLYLLENHLNFVSVDEGSTSTWAVNASVPDVIVQT